MTEARYDSTDPPTAATAPASGAQPATIKNLADKTTRNAAGHDSLIFAAAQQKDRSAEDKLHDDDHADAAVLDGAAISPMRAIAQSAPAATEHTLEPALTPTATRAIARQAYSSEH